MNGILLLLALFLIAGIVFAWAMRPRRDAFKNYRQPPAAGRTFRQNGWR